MTEQEYKEFIYEKADKVKTKEDLTNLIDEITTYGHDYGSIVYGCMAAMKAAFKVVNDGPQGGITGFQAGFIGWECVHEFMSVKAPARLLDYNNMLYPQYDGKFQKTITKDTWESLQKKANEKLEDSSTANPKVIAHWKSIKNGQIPFGYSIGGD